MCRVTTCELTDGQIYVDIPQSWMKARCLSVVDIPEDKVLLQPIKKDRRGCRSGHAYVCVDLATNSVMLASKLTSLAQHLNTEYARNRFEAVSARSLYEAADSKNGFPHKLRYHVKRCPMTSAHMHFQKLRDMGVNRASLITETCSS